MALTRATQIGGSGKVKLLKVIAGLFGLTILVLLAALYAYSELLPQGPERTGAAPTVSGKSSFVMNAYQGSDRRTLRVWTYLPDGWTDADPVLFVMHGMGRNAEDYLDTWTLAADSKRTLLIAPEFDNRFSRYVTRDYQEGNVKSVFGQANPEEEWAFTVIGNIVDRLNTENGWSIAAYDMFGHSAGGQFVQRMVMLKPDARIRRAIAANAGSYTFIDEAVSYPYGLKSVPHDMPKSLGTDLVILLGEQDNTATQGRLDTSSRAMAQGEHRLQRGTAFFNSAQEYAAENGLPSNWSLEIVPGVGHDYRKMSDAAASLF